MCYQVKCGSCGKPTWAGCGRHVPSVHAQIPEGQHCACRDWPGVAPPVEKKAAAAAADGAADPGKTPGATAAGEGSAGSTAEGAAAAQ
ncbi:unnamed protein product [Urochloa decumbens]|uniref:Uncharacterized protein n=1 Tax=Urochloa decumbens TaxID=240449 RepID=A0ABC8YIU8_9POAL